MKRSEAIRAQQLISKSDAIKNKISEMKSGVAHGSRISVNIRKPSGTETAIGFDAEQRMLTALIICLQDQAQDLDAAIKMLGITSDEEAKV